MKTLRELKDWARKKGIRGFSRMNKETLLNLWQESQPILDKKFKFDAPILIPEKTKIQKTKLPEIVEETTETISDWLNWLESVEDVKVRKRVSPRVEKLKKQIADLWSSDFVVEEMSVLGGKNIL